MTNKVLTPVEAYIESQPEVFHKTLQELRSIVKSVVPGAEEVLSYGVGCFRTQYMLVGIGATKDHCSFYTMSTGLVKRLKPELKGIKISGTTLHFPPNQPLPEDVIKRIILERVRENEERRK